MAIESENRTSCDDFNGDPLYVSGSDQLGTKLVTVLFNGSNFQRWSRAIKIALTAKAKLGFITGTCVKPVSDQAKLDQWLRVDFRVLSWILHSMVPELSDAFLYVNSSKQLWDELTERFGQSNGPLFFQLEKEISDLGQGNDSVAVYYTKLKKLWDELDTLKDQNVCTCGAMKKNSEFEDQQRLMKFLMHLNEGYDTVRGQLLLMDPLPSVSRAYSYIQQVEKQKQITGNLNINPEIASYMTNSNTLPTFNGNGVANGDNVTCMAGRNISNNSYGNSGTRRDNKKSGSQRYCDDCHETGHIRDQCFRLHGVPDWYKFKKPFEVAANVMNIGGDNNLVPTDTPLDDNIITSANTTTFETGFMNALAKEMMKMMKGKQSAVEKTSFQDAGVGSCSSSPYANFAAASSQPAFGNSTSTRAFAFGSTPPGNNDQMHFEDSMAEDSMQASSPTTPVLGQPLAPAPSPAPAAAPAPPTSSFMFGQMPSPGGFGGAAAPPSTGKPPFQFGIHQNQMTPPSPSPFQPSGSVEINAGGAGSFSLGTGGDKANRKFVKVNRRPRRK